MILDIVEIPDERLNFCSENVSQFDVNIKKLLHDMLETMYNSNGIGLAAVQVNVHKRIFVVDVPKSIYEDEYSCYKYEEGIIDKSKSDHLSFGGPYFIINPKIVELSKETISMVEGCLSVPGKKEVLTRPRFITLEFLDENGNVKILKATEWLARCIQHENDHLNGILYINHLSPLKKALIMKSAKIYKKSFPNKG